MTASEEFAAVVYHARMHMHADLPSVGINHYYLSYLRFPKVRIRQYILSGTTFACYIYQIQSKTY